MSIDSVKAIFDVASSGYDRWRKYKDPVREQAHRFLTAFEAHGIARQQIVRILPSEIDIQSTEFSDANLLKNHLSPMLLDWAAEYLALDRSWLDGVGEKPHQNVDGYKNEIIYSDWLVQRTKVDPTVNRTLFVWASSDPKTTLEFTGYLTIVYVEHGIGIDGKELSHYWTLSNKWPLSHSPCVDSMLALVRICHSLKILTVGRILNHKVLENFEKGHLLAPQVGSNSRSIWHPEDLMDSVTAA